MIQALWATPLPGKHPNFSSQLQGVALQTLACGFLAATRAVPPKIAIKLIDKNAFPDLGLIVDSYAQKIHT